MAETLVIENPKTQERRRMYTVDVKELLRGDNADGWFVCDPNAPRAPQAVNSAPVANKGDAFEEALRDAPPAGAGAGFAPPVDDVVKV